MELLPPTQRLSTVDSASFKKQLCQLYNRVYQEMFGLGVRKQRVEIFKDKIVIFAQHKRVPALFALSEKYKELTHSVDAALVTEFKRRLSEEFERQFNAKVTTVLKDYDPNTEEACTVIYLNGASS